jgi:hypothetical protein
VRDELGFELFQCLWIAFLGQLQLDPPNVILILLEIVHNYYSNLCMEANHTIESLVP